MAITLACVENIPRAITFLERSDADAEILRASFLCIKLCARLDNVVDGAAADAGSFTTSSLDRPTRSSQRNPAAHGRHRVHRATSWDRSRAGRHAGSRLHR